MTSFVRCSNLSNLKSNIVCLNEQSKKTYEHVNKKTHYNT